MTAAVYEDDKPFAPVVASRQEAARHVAAMAVSGRVPIEVTSDGVRMRDDTMAPTVLSKPTPLPRATTDTAPTVDALVHAAARSTSRRTQTLGLRLADLAEVVRKRLAIERKEAEAAERERAERDAARAEVQRLEAALADARVKAGQVRQRKPAATDAVLAATAKARAAAVGEFPCKCGRVCTTKAGLRSHERHCTGAA